MSTQVLPGRWPTSTRLGRVRLAAGYGLLLAVVPYAALKVAWLSGSPVGIPAGSPARTEFGVANAITLALDLAVVVVALALTHRWGQRLPAWTVLLPAWVGTGFLIPVVGQVAVGFGYGLLTSGRLVDLENGLVDGPTYTLVYASFAAQGLLLTLCFVLYARVRWASVLDRETALRPTVERIYTTLPRTLAGAGAAAALLVGGARLYQAVAAPDSWRAEPWTFYTRVTQGVEGLLAVAAAVGVLALAYGASRVRTAHGVVFAWTGSAVLFSWGMFVTVAAVSRAPLSEGITPPAAVVSLVSLLAGLVVALAGVLTLGRLPGRPAA
ncbi:MAG: hypothetical protein GEV10_13250 [Streptosporangiales bacterium]|nr:hypothetical protein [Streptosporangiales bacterium]